MTLGTFWALLVGGLISAGGGFVESMLAERRAGQRAERSALATKRIEQRDQLVVLVDSGRRWAVNIQTVMVASVASIWVTMETEQYKAMGRLHDEYQLQLLTAELVIDDPILGATRARTCY